MALKKKGTGSGTGEAPRIRQARPVTSVNLSQALKEGKTLEMLTAKNHTGGGYRTDDGYVFSPGDVISDTGDGFIVPPWWPFSIIFQRGPYLLESCSSPLSVLGGQAGQWAGNSHA